MIGMVVNGTADIAAAALTRTIERDGVTAFRGPIQNIALNFGLKNCSRFLFDHVMFVNYM